MAFYRVTAAVIIVLILDSAMTCDVFLSFRGKDTRKGFTDHLYREMIKAGISVFRDDNGIPRGENIETAISKAIYKAKIGIIVFSKDYGSSTWCLTELVIIMERRRTAGLKVVPLFYDVDPCEVAKQTGRYGEAFVKHEKNLKEDMQMVEGWRADLKEAADLAGMVLGERYESEFIQDIVEEIKDMLNSKVVNIASSNSTRYIPLLTKLLCSILFIFTLAFPYETDRAICESRRLILVFLKDYASSLWWQNTDCKNQEQHVNENLEDANPSEGRHPNINVWQTEKRFEEENRGRFRKGIDKMKRASRRWCISWMHGWQPFLQLKTCKLDQYLFTRETSHYEEPKIVKRRKKYCWLRRCLRHRVKR